MFDCLMEFAKADVNSPRSIRAVSQVKLFYIFTLHGVFSHFFTKANAQWEIHGLTL